MVLSNPERRAIFLFVSREPSEVEFNVPDIRVSTGLFAEQLQLVCLFGCQSDGRVAADDQRWPALFTEQLQLVCLFGRQADRRVAVDGQRWPVGSVASDQHSRSIAAAARRRLIRCGYGLVDLRLLDVMIFRRLDSRHRSARPRDRRSDGASGGRRGGRWPRERDAGILGGTSQSVTRHQEEHTTADQDEHSDDNASDSAA
jgi:hypothetical protein